MKITKKMIAIFAVVLAVAAVLLVYNFVFTKKQEATEKVEAETAKLETREGELRSHFLSLARYRKGIEEEHEIQGVILSHFPQTLCEEDEIMYIEGIEEQYEIFFKALSYGRNTPFAVFNDDSINSHLTANYLTLSGTYDGTYQGLKDVISYTNSQNGRMIINNISASYDTTTALLSGSIDFTIYSITGTDNVYVGPYIPEVNIGRNNIFGTME